MIEAVYIVALCLGAVVVSNGCVAEDRSAEDRSAEDRSAEDRSAADSELGAPGEQCGPNVCRGKTYCCNASCGICAPIGGYCTQQLCDTADAGDPTAADDGVTTPSADSGPGMGQPCGNVTCTGGTQCCNASCGICVRPGGVCTQQICEPAA